MTQIGPDFSGPPLPWGWVETALMRGPTPVTAEPPGSEDPSGVQRSVEQVSKGNGADFSHNGRRPNERGLWPAVRSGADRVWAVASADGAHSGSAGCSRSRL